MPAMHRLGIKQIGVFKPLSNDTAEIKKDHRDRAIYFAGCLAENKIKYLKQIPVYELRQSISWMPIRPICPFTG